MLDIIGAFLEKNWLSGGGKVENVLGIISAFWEKNWLSGLWYQDQHWLWAKTPIFGLKSRKRARYYRRVLREKLTFGTLISRETVIIGQNYGGRGYDQNTWLSRNARLSMSDKSHSWLSAFTLDYRLQKVEQNARSSILVPLGKSDLINGQKVWCEFVGVRVEIRLA